MRPTCARARFFFLPFKHHPPTHPLGCGFAVQYNQHPYAKYSCGCAPVRVLCVSQCVWWCVTLKVSVLCFVLRAKREIRKLENLPNCQRQTTVRDRARFRGRRKRGWRGWFLSCLNLTRGRRATHGSIRRLTVGGARVFPLRKVALFSVATLLIRIAQALNSDHVRANLQKKLRKVYAWFKFTASLWKFSNYIINYFNLKKLICFVSIFN